MATTTQNLPIYLDPSRTCPVLCMFGGKDLSFTVAGIAKCAGFQVVVIDDRAEQHQENPLLDMGVLWICDFDQAIDELRFDSNTYVAIDLNAQICAKNLLRRLLKEEPAYLGLTGDAKKVERIFSHLQEDGYSEWDLGRIHYPMGLSIGGKSIGERAVSIVAQMIDVRSRLENQKLNEETDGSNTIPWDVLLSWCR